MNTSMIIRNQLLATKFFVPVASHPLIWRPRLIKLLDESLKYPLTLISAPAGFGKTMLLSAWEQSLPASNALVAWVSLDEEDNEPQQFWINALTALTMHQPEYLSPVLKYLQSPQTPPLKQVLAVLINLLADRTEPFVLILDDYQVITEQEVHITLSYLVEYLPPQLRIILATRADPPLPLSLLRAHGQMLEVRTDQLRCTTEETRIFFQKVIGIDLPDETIQEIATRTEGWLVGLQLLALSLQGCPDPATLLEELSGDQRYILDFLTDEVLQRQPQEVQTFLLFTCILQRLTASLCDAVMQQHDSQQMLRRLEQANLFTVSLDSKHQWYRYHALFAQALRYRLEQMHADLVPLLHHRASLWYAQHDQITEAILHAFSAREWQWAADLIERIPIIGLTWGTSEHSLILLRQWLEQLPTEVVRSRPRLSLAYAQLLWTVAPPIRLQAWFEAAEARLTASLRTQMPEDASQPILTAQARQDQQDLLGEVIATRALLLQSYQEEDGQATFSLCQQALTLLSAQNFRARAIVACAQFWTSYVSSTNNAVAAIQYGLQAVSLAQAAGQTTLAINLMGTTALYMIGTGQLHEAQRLTQQAIELGTQPGGLLLPDVGLPTLLQAEILRERNELDAALSLLEEALSLCKQASSLASLMYSLNGYSVLLRIYLSRGELDAACSALQQFERISMSLNLPSSIHLGSFFTTIDRVRLWLASGELKRATRWVQKLDVTEQHSMPFAREREEVARARILLAKDQPDLALLRLEPVLQRATMGQRWGHLIEVQLLQALAHQMRHEEIQALHTISQAVRLAEPEGYIRRFVDEGAPMAALLSRLREEQGSNGATPYLDTVLAAFSQQSKAHEYRLKRASHRAPRLPNRYQTS